MEALRKLRGRKIKPKQEEIGQKVSDGAANDVTSSKEDIVEAENGSVDGTPGREAWGGKLEFILTCVGYAVGLGNVWRFPYLCYKNGGGAFLIPYIIMLALVGLPLFFLELSFGQFASQGPLSVWAINPLFKGLGYAMVIVSTLIGLYYNIIIAWCIYYFFASMTSSLPWAECGNSWNTDLCVHSRILKNESLLNDTLEKFNMTRQEIKTPSEEYFYNQVLGISEGIEVAGPVKWELALCLLLAWTLVFLVLIKGISSLGKVVYFSSIFPYVLLTCMLVRGATLEGASKGIEYYMKPDFSRLADATVWSDAAVQIFYSLSACSGGLIAMASFNKFDNNCLRDSLIVPLINCCTSVYAGFVIFSVLGYMSVVKGVEVKDVAQSGPGLVFVVYPEGLTQMPVAPLWAILFFFMMMTLGFSSEFSIVECFFSSFVDEFSFILRKKRLYNLLFRGLCCLAFYLLGLPMVTRGGFYLFNLVDTYVGGFPLLFIGLFEIIVLMFIYGWKRFDEDIEIMLGKKPNIYFKATWLFFSPLLLLAIIVFKAIQYKPLTLFETYTYPAFATALGWLIVLCPLIFIPGWMIGRILNDGGWQIIKKASKATPEWRPALASDRIGTKYEDRPKRTIETISESVPPPAYGTLDVANGGMPQVKPGTSENIEMGGQQHQEKKKVDKSELVQAPVDGGQPKDTVSGVFGSQTPAQKKTDTEVDPATRPSAGGVENSAYVSEL